MELETCVLLELFVIFAVAVIVLDGGSLGSEATGGQVAAPIGRAVLEAALGA